MPVFFRVFFLLCVAHAFMYARAQEFSYANFSTETNQEMRLKMGIESWNYYIKNNIDSLKIIGLELLPAKKQSKRDRQLYAVGTRNLGSYLIRGSDILKGIGLLNEAKNEFAKQELNVLLSETENDLGNAYFLQGNYQRAAQHYLSSMKIGQETADETASFNGMIGLGKATCASGDTLKGIRLVEQFLAKCLTLKKFESASDACGFLGMIAGEQNKLELMSAYYNRGIKYAKRSGSITHQANALNNKAIDFYYHEQLDSTLAYFNRALELRLMVGTINPIVESKYNIAVLHLENGDFVLAKKCAEEGEEIARVAVIRSWQLDCLRLLQEIAVEMNNPEESAKLAIEITRIEKELTEIDQMDTEILEAALDYGSTPIPVKSSSSMVWTLVALAGLFAAVLMLFFREQKEEQA
jgi:tetratricopeptide (TPR) repeat protein